MLSPSFRVAGNATSGIVTITLTVTDSDSQTASATFTVLVR